MAQFTANQEVIRGLLLQARRDPDLANRRLARKALQGDASPIPLLP